MRKAGVFVLMVLAGVALLALSQSPALAFENTECLGCHAVGGTATVQVDYTVPPVDKTNCWNCHYQSGHGQAGYYIADSQTPYGWFDTPVSPYSDPSLIHLVHKKSRPADWNPGDNITGVNACGGCHYPADCSACHGSSVPHTDHTYDTSASAYVYPPLNVKVTSGVSSGQRQADAIYWTELTCANASCHGVLGGSFNPQPRCDSCHGTHGTVSHTYDDFSTACQSCHQGTNTLPEVHQPYADANGMDVCSVCHGTSGIATGKSANCFSCHSSAGPAKDFTANHPYDPPTHEATSSCFGQGCHVSQTPDNHTTSGCEQCHQTSFSTTGLDPKDCLSCHDGRHHDPGVNFRGWTICAGCHETRKGMVAVSGKDDRCWRCHGKPGHSANVHELNRNTGDYRHAGVECYECHAPTKDGDPWYPPYEEVSCLNCHSYGALPVPSDEGVIRGIVVDAQGSPLNQVVARISPGGYVLHTDRNGYYEQDGLAEGDYAVSVEKSNYDPQTKNVYVGRGQTVTVDFVLVSEG